MVKKANLSGEFQINLAFFRHLQTLTAVNYQIDFAVIKQGRARHSVTFAAGTKIDIPEKVSKMSATDSAEQSILCKSSAITSTSAGTCESEENVSSLLVVESQGVHTITKPPVLDKPSTDKGGSNCK